MRSLPALAILLFLNTALWAQESTKAPDINKYLGGESDQTRLMLIPFDPILYMSDVDKELAEKEKMNFEQLRQKVRWELDFTIGNYLKVDYHVLAPLREQDPAVQKDLEYLFSSIAFSYEKIPTLSRPESKMQPRAREPKAQKTEIKDGQVISKDINYERYMATVIKEADLLPYLNKKYDPEYYLFITQMELKYDFMKPSAELPGNFNRLVNVHYNIIDKFGKRLAGGIASAPFSAVSDRVQKISNEAFSEIAYQVKSALPAASSHEIKQADSVKQKN